MVVSSSQYTCPGNCGHQAKLQNVACLVEYVEAVLAHWNAEETKPEYYTQLCSLLKIYTGWVRHYWEHGSQQLV